MEERRPPLVVADCSVAISALLEDEQEPYAINAFERFRDGAISFVVPAHFLLEAANVLLIQLRKRRLQHAIYERERRKLLTMPFDVDNALLDSKAIEAIGDLAEHYGLTTYDAAYLELARRRKASLATLDNDLRKAAHQAKVALFA